MIKEGFQLRIFSEGIADQSEFLFCFFQAFLLKSNLIDSASVLFSDDYVLIHDYLPALRAPSFAMLSAIRRSLVSGVIFLLMILEAMSQEIAAT